MKQKHKDIKLEGERIIKMKSEHIERLKGRKQ